MEMNLAHEFKTGEIISVHVEHSNVLVFANGVIREGDTVCIWFKDDSLMSGVLYSVDGSKMRIEQHEEYITVRCCHIAYIAKKENGKWKLMREATDGKA